MRRYQEFEKACIGENGEYIHDKLFKEGEKEFYDSGDKSILWNKCFYPAYHAAYNVLKKKHNNTVYNEIEDDAMDMVIEFFKTMNNKYLKGKRTETKSLINSVGFMTRRTSNQEEGDFRRGYILSTEELLNNISDKDYYYEEDYTIDNDDSEGDNT